MTFQKVSAGRLRAWREALNLTQQTLAQELGVTEAAVGHWETCRHPISQRTSKQLVALADKWGVKSP